MSSQMLGDETKSLIRGILISSPLQCTVKSLCSDFYETVGYPIPFKRLGFNSIETYLHSIPDTVRVHGAGIYATIDLITSNRSAHIAHMVQKQRLPKTKTYGRRAVHIHLNTRSRQNENASASTSNMQQLNSELRSNCSLEDVTSDPEMSDSEIGLEHENDEKSTYNCSLEDGTSNLEMPMANIVSDHENVEIPINTSIHHVPRLRTQMKDLMRDFPNGILLTEFVLEYEKRYRQTIEFDKLNYRTMWQLCGDLPEIMNCIPVGNNFYLHDPNVNVDQYINQYLRNSGNIHENSEDNEASAVELAKLDWSISPTLIPPNAVYYGEIINRSFISNTYKIKDYLDIEVTEIYDPSKFFVYLPDEGLFQLQSSIQKFYNTQSRRVQIPQVLQIEGLYCISLYMGIYHRALIINMLHDVPNKIRVLYIDYGTVSNISTSDVFFLDKEFSSLPSQAIRARLSNIYPATKNTPWSHEAKCRFRTLLAKRMICAEITKIDRINYTLDLYVADYTDERNIFYINDVLVKEGHAIYHDEKQKDFGCDWKHLPIPEYIHLYPTFLEIELGMLPNGCESVEFRKMGILSHHYMSKYYPRYSKINITDVERLNETSSCKGNLGLNSLIDKKKTRFDMSLFSKELREEISDVAADIKGIELSSEELHCYDNVVQYSCKRYNLKKLQRLLEQRNHMNTLSIESNSNSSLTSGIFSNEISTSNSQSTLSPNEFNVTNTESERNPFKNMELLSQVNSCSPPKIVDANNPFAYHLQNDDYVSKPVRAKEMDKKIAKQISTKNKMPAPTQKFYNNNNLATVNMTDARASLSNYSQTPIAYAPIVPVPNVTKPKIGPPPGFQSIPQMQYLNNATVWPNLQFQPVNQRPLLPFDPNCLQTLYGLQLMHFINNQFNYPPFWPK